MPEGWSLALDVTVAPSELRRTVRRAYFSRIVVQCAVAVLWLCLVLGLYFEVIDGWGSGYLLLTLAALVGLLLVAATGVVVSVLLERRGATGPHTVVLDDGGIVSATDVTRAAYPWTAIVDTLEDERTFAFLLSGVDVAAVIPKRTLAATDLEVVRRTAIERGRLWVPTS